MKSVSAKELKNRTGAILELIEDGQRVLITMRGKPFAVIMPVNESEKESAQLPPYEEAWNDIEETLQKTKARFRSVDEAMKWTRKR